MSIINSDDNIIKQEEDVVPHLANIKFTNREEKLRKRRKTLIRISSLLLLVLAISAISYIIRKRIVNNGLLEIKKSVDSSIDAVNKVYGRDDWRFAYEKSLPNLVGVSKTSDGFSASDFRQVSSGVVISDKGLIAVPGDFVASSDQKIYVKSAADSRGAIHEANLVGIDNVSGVAIYHTQDVKYSPTDRVEEHSLRLADTIFVVAAPFGTKEYGNLKNGTLHTKSQFYTITDDNNNQSKVKIIMGSFPIDRSNNGGAVIDIHGKVVGIASNGLTKKVGLENTFAVIPMAEVDTIVQRLVSKDSSTNYILGVKGNYVRNEKTSTDGFYVLEVINDTTAQRGGLLPTDMILEIDGKPVSSQKDINWYIKNKKIGDLVNIKIERRNEIINLAVKIY